VPRMAPETLRFVGVALAAMVAFRFMSELGLGPDGAGSSTSAKDSLATPGDKNEASVTGPLENLTATKPNLGKGKVLIQFCSS
ncbi:unnamed protein product, partial [Polarella glacialis]